MVGCTHNKTHRFISTLGVTASSGSDSSPAGTSNRGQAARLLTKATLIAILGCTTGTARLTKFAQWEIQTYTHTRTRRWQLHTGRTNTCRGTAKGLLRASWLCCAAPLLSMENSNKLCFSKNTQPQNPAKSLNARIFICLTSKRVAQTAWFWREKDAAATLPSLQRLHGHTCTLTRSLHLQPQPDTQHGGYLGLACIKLERTPVGLVRVAKWCGIALQSAVATSAL